MKKLILVFSLIVFSISAFSQLNETEFIEKLNKDILVGKCDREGLKLPCLGDWYNAEYEAYEPGKRTIRKLKSILSDDISITIILATWCHDSRRELPRFFKVLDQIGLGDNHVLMYSTDLKKEVKGKDITNLDIQRVPTFIIYKNGVEIGRIIESPKRNLEKDLLKILKKYKAKKLTGLVQPIW